MPIIQCPHGHYYDDVKYRTCPHCEAGLRQSPDGDSKTVAMYQPDVFNIKETAREYLTQSGTSASDKTIGIFISQMESDPVVGWLVNTDGPEKGRDYRLHTGRNFVGRSLRMDVTIADDAEVSRENHCSVVYDPVGNTFSLLSGEGTNTYLNGRPLTGPLGIIDGDTIQLGGTKLVFTAFCKGERKWL